jgi:hypothetical protein
MVERLGSVAVPAATGLTAEFCHGARIMKRMLVGTAMVLAALATAGGAEAKGCIKGAIVGGVAGHMAGHGKVGAVAGCVIGRHEANKADADRAAQKRPSDRDHRI